jgi:L-fucose mutarotase
MLKYAITHPLLLHSLAQAGHGSRILLADSNYAFDAFAPQNATRVYLNFAPGLIAMEDVLSGILQAIPVEAALAVLADDGAVPTITMKYRELLPDAVPLDRINRFDFYAKAKELDTTLVVATGETSHYANLLLTVGFLNEDGTPNY